MAAKFESSGLAGFAAANNNNAVVLTLPATRPVGSVLLIFAFAKLITATVTTAPAGYTLLGTWTSGTAGGGRCWLYAKEVVGGETAPSIAITGATGTTGEEWGAGMSCYSDVDLAGGIANILDGTATVTDAAGTTTCTYAANTIAQADSMLVRFLARWEDANITFTGSAGYTQRHGVSTTNRTGANFQAQDKLATASGVQASSTVTPSASTNIRYLAISLALKSKPPDKFGTLTDDFATTVDKSVKWKSATAQVVWEAGQAKLPSTASVSVNLRTDVNTGPFYDLIGSSIAAKVTLPPNATNRFCRFQIIASPPVFNNQLQIYRDPAANQLFAIRTLDGINSSGSGTVTYDPVAHAWWRIRESGGTVYCEAGPDGVNYPTLLGSWATSTCKGLGSGWVEFLISGGTTDGASMFVDNVNYLPPSPLYETLLDDFTRADNPVYTNAENLWAQNRLDWSTLTLARVIGNRLGNPGATYEQALSIPTLGPGDFDFLVDCAVTGASPSEIAIWFCLANTGTASATMRGFCFIGSAATAYWAVRRYANGANQGTIVGPAAISPIVAGDTWWCAKRGNHYTIYRKAGSGDYSKVIEFDDIWGYTDGPIAIEMSDATIRWDNVRGGPWTGLGPSTKYGVVAQAITFGKAVVAQPQTRYGVVALPVTFIKAVSGVRKAFGVVALPMTFSKAVVGQRKTFGVVALPVTFTKAVSGVRKTFGVSAMPITFGKDVKAVLKKFGVVAAPFTFSSTTQGKLTALGKVVMTITFGKDVLWGTPTTKVLNKLNTFNMGVTPVKRIYAGIKQVWP
jgi:hypothetical protein